jgi:SAM-dependent methyltransferase
MPPSRSKLYTSLVNWFSKNPQRYNLIHLIINWGLPYDKVAQLIDLKSDDSVLEIACGPALILDYIGESNYIGIDLNLQHLNHAKSKYSSRKNTIFIHSDILGHDFSQYGNFDKILMLGFMHHLPDDDLKKILSIVSQLLNKKNPESSLVTFDPVRTKYHFISNRLCDLDVGRFVRHKDDYLDLLNNNLKVLDSNIISSRTKFAMYLTNRAIYK